MLAGAVMAFAPDHWLPASVFTWQKGWRAKKAAAFTFLAFGAHLCLGFVIYFAFHHLLDSLDAQWLLMFSWGLVFSVMWVRIRRFSRVREVLRSGPNGRWGGFAVISLLGPCEALIPILIKAHHLGLALWLPCVAFLAGTSIVGIACVLISRALWDRPLWLPRSMQWAQSRSAALPVIVGLVLGLGALIRIG